MWSYGALVCELLRGRPLARSGSGHGWVTCMLGAIGPFPSNHHSVKTYGNDPRWKALLVSALGRASTRTRIPKSASWDVPSTCLKLSPIGRKKVSQVLEMPWLRRDNVSCDSSCPDAESKITTPAEPDRGPACPLDVPSFSQTALKLSMDYSMRIYVAKDPCACSGHCRIGKH